MPSFSITDVKYASHYKVYNSGLGQLVRQLHEISYIDNPISYIDDWLIDNIPNLIEKYEDLINVRIRGDEAYQVRLFNLTHKLPASIRINEDTCDIKLGNAKLSLLIQEIYQRINFIINRDTPVFYNDNISQINEYSLMKEDLIHFNTYLQKFEKNFVNAVHYSRHCD